MKDEPEFIQVDRSKMNESKPFETALALIFAIGLFAGLLLMGSVIE